MRFFWNKPKKSSNETASIIIEIPVVQSSVPDFVAIDFETAQGPRWSVCQIGLAVVENGEIKQSHCHYIQPPENHYAPGNIYVHKITPDKTMDAPTFPDIWEKIRPYIENRLIVAHNASFDIDCLIKTLDYYQLDVPEFHTDCTFNRTGMSLKDACAAYNVDLLNHHDAECDAKACACIYMHLINGVEPSFSREVTSTVKRPYDFAGHDVIKGDLLKPNLENADKTNPFYGKKVVFTGILNNIDRTQAAVSVKNLGADIDTGITKRTNYVIVGENPGYAKLGKIEKYNSEGSDIRIIYEHEFLKMLN